MDTDTLYDVERVEFEDGYFINLTKAPEIVSGTHDSDSIDITFDELVRIINPRDIAVHKGSVDGELVPTGCVVAECIVAEGNTISISLHAPLEAGTSYFVTFDSGAVSDYLNEDDAHLYDGSVPYNFTTEAAYVGTGGDNGDDSCSFGECLLWAAPVGVILWSLL
ncbi:MAG: Ig-like domain-containing protein [Chlorobium phaeovibrioides]|nr:Ig-like domain-containing protein [Chlorobium phaeovibrioides]